MIRSCESDGFAYGNAASLLMKHSKEESVNNKTCIGHFQHPFMQLYMHIVQQKVGSCIWGGRWGRVSSSVDLKNQFLSTEKFAFDFHQIYSRIFFFFIFGPLFGPHPLKIWKQWIRFSPSSLTRNAKNSHLTPTYAEIHFKKVSNREFQAVKHWMHFSSNYFLAKNRVIFRFGMAK